MTKVSAGVGIMITNEAGQVLLGLRNDDPEKAASDLHGEGTWTFPGGKIDFGDSIYESAAREVKEETDLDVQDMALFSISNNIAGESQYLTFGLKATKYSGEVKTMEPEEITEWKWFDLDKLPDNLYFPTRKMINMFAEEKLVDLKEK